MVKILAIVLGHGGITGRLRDNGIVTYSYNLGTIENSSDGRYVGGILGQNSCTSDSTATISYCYNFANVTSNGIEVGGICGVNYQNCYIKECYIANTVTVKYASTSATQDIGVSNNYLGRIIGHVYLNTSTYINHIGILSNMPNVYDVVSKEENENSNDYWSTKAYSDEKLKTPKLKWEVKE